MAEKKQRRLKNSCPKCNGSFTLSPHPLSEKLRSALCNSCGYETSFSQKKNGDWSTGAKNQTNKENLEQFFSKKKK